MVPRAEFQSYYGRPVIKPPTWKTPDVPAYFFLGGLAGASSAMATLAEIGGRPRLVRIGTLAAGLGAAGGTAALIHDLGRPERFLNMLRVFKPTSPLSMGSWLLASFGTLSGAAAASTVTGLLPRAGTAARAGAAVLSPVMMTYTAVLVADTAVPIWHDGHRELPFVFAGGSLTSGGGLGMVCAPPKDSGPARAMAVAGAGLELVAEQRMSSRLGMVAEPYHRGRSGRWMRAGKLLTAAGALGTLAARRSRVASVASGAALLAGALCTRFGVFDAGMVSAKDPKYTVVPQRHSHDHEH
ncbi:polysulfide reductase NrfD [Phytoactinopolyspora halotolerans]|uniref:Polysulfide reductase NrfD n=2 Tax=Phytoactinopolyspora halotolerans TaxID=1981512 RepID=A0A6L9SDE9_9ACTN|nr:polysulfide reductase NrfD [Phytoactinopolyspora halotolerans]